MAKYRKKPVVIEAVQIRGGQLRGISPPWFVKAVADGYAVWGDDGLAIRTLEGKMLAGEGDWIICGVKGELYPCKNDIFRATYDNVDE